MAPQRIQAPLQALLLQLLQPHGVDVPHLQIKQVEHLRGAQGRQRRLKARSLPPYRVSPAISQGMERVCRVCFVITAASSHDASLSP